jgi:hypothetical protein
MTTRPWGFRVRVCFAFLLSLGFTSWAHANGFWDGISFHCDGQQLASHYVATYTGLWAAGGRTAWLKVSTYDPNAVLLHIAVYDDNNHLVISYPCTTTLSSNCILNWTPKWNGDYYVKFENEGSDPVAYDWHYTNTVGWYSSPSINCY